MASTFRERRLPPAEVRRVLRRAAELAESDPETASVQQTLTGDELARRAAELGLPASAVARAMAAPDAPAPDGKGPWLAPRTVTLEQAIVGELPAERHEEVVHAIRAVTRLQGHAEVLGRTLTWSAAPQVPPLVTIRTRDGQTSVRVEERLQGVWMIAAFSLIGLFPSLVAAGVALDVTRSGLWGFVAATLVMVCALAGSAWISARTVRRREALLHRLMEQTTAAVLSAVDRPASASGPARGPRIAAPGDAEAPRATEQGSPGSASPEAEEPAEEEESPEPRREGATR